MSLSREVSKEICDYIRENSVTLFGQKFRECRFVASVQAQTKADKYETKFLAISKFRVFVLSGKQFSHLKTEKSFNVLALRHLNVTIPESGLSVGWEERGGRATATLLLRTADEREANELACEFLSSLKHYLPDIRPSLGRLLSIHPPALLNAFGQLPASTPDLPCNNFRRSYVTYCDYYDLLYRDEVSWDIENIYFIHDIHEIRLDDFNHLPIRDQVTVICCAQFSAFFTGICADGCRLGTELVDAILSVVRRSHALKSLSLVGCGISKDFPAQLAAAIQQNYGLPLEYLNLSNNSLDDKKGIGQLAMALPKIHTFKSLLLNDCGLSDKSVHHLASGLYTGFSDFGAAQSSCATVSAVNSAPVGRFELAALHLAGNSLRDDANELLNFVSLCNTLRVLNLSNTGLMVDRLWSALKLGGLRLERLLLAGCSAASVSATGKKSGRDNLHAIVKELFSSMVGLKELDLTSTPIGAEVLQHILMGLANNNCISDISLNLNGVLEASKGDCATILERHLVGCSIADLSLRDNAIEQDATKILPALARMAALRRLDLGGANFHALRANKKHGAALSKVLHEIGDLLSNPDSHIEELVLSDCRLGAACMSVVLEPLVGAGRLKTLDVSGNELSNAGARFISKALQLNGTLRTVHLDRNLIGIEGFAELEHAVNLNHSLCAIPFPLNDAAAVADRVRVTALFEKIDQHLARNRNDATLANRCCQAALQSLIINCDHYNINASDENKIIFHNFLKSVADMRRNSDSASDAVDGLLPTLTAAIERAGAEQAGKLMRLFQETLATRRVELSADIGVDILNGLSDIFERESLKIELRRVVENYLTQTTWRNLERKSDALLRSPNALKLRGGALLNFTIDHSVHAAVTAAERAAASALLGRRPNSMFPESLVASLTEVLATQDEPPLTDKPSTPLVHLAKSRPRPARQFRSELNTSLKHSYGSLATDDSFDYVNSSISSSRVERKSRQSSDTDSNHHSATVDIGDERAIGSPQLRRTDGTPPPPLIPRRHKSAAPPLFGGVAPPKLPPKPAGGIGGEVTGNGHTKHRVSPTHTVP